MFDFDDGSKAAFSLEDDSNATIYPMHPDGSSLHPVNLHGARGIRPSVSPDGTKLLYVRIDGLHETVVLHDLVSHDEQTLAVATLTPPDGRPYLSKGAVSPNNQLIAYGSWPELHLVSADGSGDHVLVPNSGVEADANPVFSPDSSTLYFAEGYVESIHVDGSSRRVYTQSGGAGFSLSPDGTRLVAELYCSGADQLRIVPVPSLPVDSCAGKELAVLGVYAPPEPMDSAPSWGPGDVIAYQDGWAPGSSDL